MHQLTYVGPGQLDWQEVPEPAFDDPRACVVRPTAVARCDLDLPMVTAGLFPGPFPVGHEIAAEVVEVGEAVVRHEPGDQVIVPFQVSCGDCAPCRGGAFAACSTFMAPLGGSFGFGPSGGGHCGGVADLMLVPAADHLLVPAPAGRGAATLATLSDNVVDGYRAVAPPLRARPGSSVLVVASTPGSIALYAAAVAIAAGAAHVRYVDRDAERVAAAERLGAEAVVHAGLWPKRFEPAAITVDATGDPDGLATVIRSTERYGSCTSVSVYFDATTPMPLLDMYTRGITFHTSRADSRRFLPEVLDLLASTSFDPMAVPTTIVPWESAATAWLEPAVKLVVAR